MKRVAQLSIITFFLFIVSACCTLDKTQFPAQRNFESDTSDVKEG